MSDGLAIFIGLFVSAIIIGYLRQIKGVDMHGLHFVYYMGGAMAITFLLIVISGRG